MKKLTLNHLLMVPHLEKEIPSFIYYLFTWILCHHSFPSLHQVRISSFLGKQQIQCDLDKYKNIHLTVIPHDYSIQIEKPEIQEWNNQTLYNFLKKLTKKLQDNYPATAKVLNRFLKNEFSLLKKSYKQSKSMQLAHHDITVFLPWFEGFYVLDKTFDEKKYKSFYNTLLPLTKQIEKNQKELSFIIYHAIYAHMQDLDHAIHHEELLEDVISKIRQDIHTNIDKQFQFVQTKEVNFREMILCFYEFYLDLFEIENEAFRLIVKLQALFALVIRENPIQGEVVLQQNENIIENMNAETMLTIHPLLRTSMISNFCKLNYSLLQ